MELDDIRSFEWDEAKRQANLAKHGLDFEDAVLALDEDAYLFPSTWQGEERWIAVCRDDARLIAVVFTMRGNVCRIISVRVARRNERRKYHARHG